MRSAGYRTKPSLDGTVTVKRLRMIFLQKRGRPDPRLLAQTALRVTLWTVAVAIFIVGGMTLVSPSVPVRAQSSPFTVAVTPSVVSTTPTQTPTPLPPELINNQRQTIGLTLVAMALVLIVVIGVFNTFVKYPGDNHV
jgi:hypothetical protein